MKIDIITFHFVNNGGSVLQTYALQTYLEKQGHTVEIINYSPVYHTNQYAVRKNPFVSAVVRWRSERDVKFIKRAYRTLRTVKTAIRSWKKPVAAGESSFAEFRRKYLHETREYKTLRQLRRDAPEADVYITGSDQIWNSENTGGRFDEAYFLRFGGEKIRKISYAASNRRTMSQREKDKFRKLCASPDYLSMREYIPETVEATGRDVHICPDPTLLLRAEDYAPLEKPLDLPEKYIYVYPLKHSEELIRVLDEVRKELDCPVINGNPSQFVGEDVIPGDPAVGSFLTYIRHAAFVVTDSFHAAAFSVYYERPFLSLYFWADDPRLQLFVKLGLSHRLHGEGEKTSVLLTEDYAAVKEKADEIRADGERWLSSALAGVPEAEIPHSPCEIPPVHERNDL